MLTIPRGKKLRIREGTKSVVGGIPLVLDEDVTLSLSSNFAPLLGGGNTKLLNLVGLLTSTVTRGESAFSGQFKQFGFQMWEGTDPLAFSATLSFYMGSTEANNAKIEVYDPMIQLASLVLPTENTNVNGNLVAPGPPITAALEGLVEGFQHRNISIEIARLLRINSIIIKRAEPTFNTETDENGYPISGKIQLDINSLFTATVELLTNRNFEAENKVKDRRGQDPTR